jgi:hypothetical protein
MIDWNDIWSDLKENWHKYGVILLMVLAAWKYFMEYVRPVVHKEKGETVIKIPKEGVKITIEPLDKNHSGEDS